MDKDKKIGLSLVLPCFNEAQNIPLLIKKIKEFEKNFQYPLEIIIVDGFSDDETQDLLKVEFDDLDPYIYKLILQNSRKGYGFDIKKGLSISKMELLSWTHTDLQTDLNDVKKGFEIYLNNSEERKFIKGKRRGRAAIDTALSIGMQIVSWIILGKYLDDINAQPKLFEREFYEKNLVDQSPDDFSLDLHSLYMAKNNAYKIIDFEVDFSDRLYGEAKGGGGSLKNKILLIRRTFKYILELSKIKRSYKSH